MQAQQQTRLRQGLANRDPLLQTGLLQQQLAQKLARNAADAGNALAALRALCGDMLPTLQARALPSPATSLPAPLAYQLLARRADLQAALWRVQAALGRVQAAQAAYYPQLDLRAALGLDSSTLARLPQMASRSLFAGLGLSLPLFHSDTLDAQLQGARSERNALLADYNQRVLDAVREAAQAALTLQEQQQLRAQQALQLQQRQALLQHSRQRLQQGLAARSEVLQAQLALAQEEDGARQLHSAALQADLRLIQALGGGYHQTTLPPLVAGSMQAKEADHE